MAIELLEQYISLLRSHRETQKKFSPHSDYWGYWEARIVLQEARVMDLLDGSRRIFAP